MGGGVWGARLDRRVELRELVRREAAEEERGTQRVELGQLHWSVGSAPRQRERG